MKDIFKKIGRFIYVHWIIPHAGLWKERVDFWAQLLMLGSGIYIVIEHSYWGWGIIFWWVYTQWLVVRKNDWKYKLLDPKVKTK